MTARIANKYDNIVILSLTIIYIFSIQITPNSPRAVATRTGVAQRSESTILH